MKRGIIRIAAGRFESVPAFRELLDLRLEIVRSSQAGRGSVPICCLAVINITRPGNDGLSLRTSASELLSSDLVRLMRLKFMVFCTITGYFNYLARLLWSDTRVRINRLQREIGPAIRFYVYPIDQALSTVGAVYVITRRYKNSGSGIVMMCSMLVIHLIFP